MKLNNKQTTSVELGNVAELERWGVSTLNQTPYWSLLLVLAELCEEIADGENSYIIIGSTQRRTAFTASLVSGGSKATAYAPSFVDLGPALADLVTLSGAS